MIQYDSAGTLKWDKFFTSSGSLDEMATDIAVSDDGVIAVSGYIMTSWPETDYFTVLMAADGDTLWTRQWHAGSGDMAGAVGFDPSGDILVSGKTGTVKYSRQGEGCSGNRRRFQACGCP